MLVSPLKTFSAAYSVDLKNGISKSFLFVKSVLIKPGDTTETLTLNFLKSKYILSAKFVNAAFDGPYPLELGSPL